MDFVRIPNYNMAYGESLCYEEAPSSYYNGLEKFASIEDAWLAGYEAGFEKVAAPILGKTINKVTRDAAKAGNETAQRIRQKALKDRLAERAAKRKPVTAQPATPKAPDTAAPKADAPAPKADASPKDDLGHQLTNGAKNVGKWVQKNPHAATAVAAGGAMYMASKNN